MRTSPFWPADDPDSEDRLPHEVAYQYACKFGTACQKPVYRRIAGNSPGAQFMVGGERSKAVHVVFLCESAYKNDTRRRAIGVQNCPVP